jgi:hypothetical protein
LDLHLDRDEVLVLFMLPHPPAFAIAPQNVQAVISNGLPAVPGYPETAGDVMA